MADQRWFCRAAAQVVEGDGTGSAKGVFYFESSPGYGLFFRYVACSEAMCEARILWLTLGAALSFESKMSMVDTLPCVALGAARSCESK